MNSCGGLLARVLVAAVAVFGLNVVVAEPAAAAISWQPYTRTDRWHCRSTEAVIDGLVTYSCVIVNGRYTQAATIVTNDTTQTVSIRGVSLELISNKFADPLYTEQCVDHQLDKGLSRACLGPTKKLACNHYVQSASDTVVHDSHGRPVGFDPIMSPTHKMCTR